MPVAVPPLEDTLVKVTLNGVVLLLRVISTAVALGALIVPLVVVMVLLLSVATNPVWPESGEMSREPKVIVPVSA